MVYEQRLGNHLVETISSALALPSPPACPEKGPGLISSKIVLREQKHQGSVRYHLTILLYLYFWNVLLLTPFAKKSYTVIWIQNSKRCFRVQKPAFTSSKLLQLLQGLCHWQPQALHNARQRWSYRDS